MSLGRSCFTKMSEWGSSGFLAAEPSFASSEQRWVERAAQEAVDKRPNDNYKACDEAQSTCKFLQSAPGHSVGAEYGLATVGKLCGDVWWDLDLDGVRGDVGQSPDPSKR